VYWVHLVWVAYQFISLIFIWWFQFRLRELQTWSFPTYGFLIIYFTVAYLQCVILLPRDPPHDQGFRDYYYDRRKWFFGLWILGLLLDIGDSAIKGREHFASLGLEYPVRAALQIGLYVTAAFWSNERFHAALALASLFYVITWALRVYPQLG